ncbi:hypothetical protein B0H11DRAFT_1990105 [Mycena galericulata]|nr:hypothetical protein B0H11DRAFT_1990105 [Mycena galericulata]
MDTRAEKLSRGVENLVTETKLRDGRGNRALSLVNQGAAPPPPADVATAPASPASPAASPHLSSVEGFDADEQLFARLDDVEHKVDDALELAHGHGRALEHLEGRLEAPFTLGQLSGAMKQQFATITKDRDTLADRIETDKADQTQANRAHAAVIAGMQNDIRMLQATISRLELTGGTLAAPLSARHQDLLNSHTRSRSRSRSPLPRHPHSRSRSPREFGGDYKRPRHNTDVHSAPVKLVVGPIMLATTLSPYELFDLHLRTAIPAHPRPGNSNVERMGQYLHIRGPSMAEAQALIRAWNEQTVGGYKEVKIALVGEGNLGGNNATGNGGARRPKNNRDASRGGGSNGGPPRRSYPNQSSRH